jgi:aryl-alcohol dehydrogenase-like predicted oxidoreductase
MGCCLGIAKASEGAKRVNRLALGTVQFGLPYGIANQTGQVSRRQAKAMLQIAAANDIDTLDTAIAYGDSEKCLGEVGTQDFKLITKLPALPDNCTDVGGWVREQVATSLAKLGVHAVYGLLLHRPEQLLGVNRSELYKALQDLKVGGQVQKWGVSIYSPKELEAISERYSLDLVQAPFNLVDRRLQITGWLQRLKGRGVEIHTRSTFLQGLLLMSPEVVPERFAPWDGLWAKWHGWLAHHDVSAVQACLAFPLSFPEIDRVVVGADSVDQLRQIIDAARNTPPVDLPDLHCEDENLINPAHWSSL